MTERTDLTTDWGEATRLIEIASPSVNIILQDLHDTLKSNTKQAGEGHDDNQDDDPLIDSAGKEDLGGGVLVGITGTLLRAQVLFESRITPTSSGTVTTGDANGTNLIDSAGSLVTDGVTRGAVIINFTDESITEVLSVNGEGDATTRVLRSGITDQFSVNDVYKVWNIIQCEIEGGNLVAVDESPQTETATSISPIFPTAFTQIVRTSSSSATLQELADIQFASFNGGVWVDTVGGTPGTVFPTGTERQPVSNFTDALTIAITRGFLTLYILGDATVDNSNDFSNYRLIGAGQNLVTLTLDPNATFVNTTFSDATITGTLDGDSHIEDCTIAGLTFVSGVIENCILDAGTIILGGSEAAHFINCASGVPGVSTPIIDMGGSGQALALRNYNGGIEIRNKSGADSVSIDMNSGQIILDSTVTAGTLICRGVGKLTDNSVGATVVNELLTGTDLKEVWKLLGLDPNDKITITPAGVTTENASFVISFTGDGIASTTMDRTA